MQEIKSRIAKLSPEKRAILQKRLTRKSDPAEHAAERIPLRDKSAHSIPLSFAQQRIWIVEQLGSEPGLYNIPIGIRLLGPLNVSALGSALNGLIARHESLRTVFISEDGVPRQRVCESRVVTLRLIDVTHISETERHARTEALVIQEAVRPFDLSSGLPVRALLVRLDEQEHVFVLTLHHIVCDGWSIGIIQNELARMYKSYCRDCEPVLPPLPIQYSDYACWQRQRFNTESMKPHLEFWKRKLSAWQDLSLQNGRARPASPSFKGGYRSLDVPAHLASRLKALGDANDSTLFITTLAAFQILLMRYSGQTVIPVGSPVAGREQIETEGLVGHFVNSLVLRGDLTGNPSFTTLLARTRSLVLEAHAHQDIPFEKLVEELQPDREPGKNPFFQVMLVCRNSPIEFFDFHLLRTEPYKIHTGTAKNDLILVLTEDGPTLNAEIEFNASLFNASAIDRMLVHFLTLLEQITAAPHLKIHELEMLSLGEQILFRQWNETHAEIPNACIHELFEVQAAATPDAVALVFDGAPQSYEQLNAQANRVAHHLRSLSCGPETLVAICMERSFELIAGILGILKAGAAYVPLDPAYPKERLAFMLEDTRAPVLLTQRKLLGNLPAHISKIVCLERGLQGFPGLNQANPVVPVTPENLAYVTFTSGSTGRPKGACIPHRAVVRLVRATNYARFGPDEVMLQFAPVTFDASTFEIWGALLNGAKLAICPPHMPMLSELGEFIRENKVSTLWLTAGLFNQIADENLEALAPVRQILTGGDVLSVPHLKKALEKLNGPRLINGYGPTENTTFTVCHQIEARDCSGSSIPIGRPISNTHVCVLDPFMKPVPVGVPGELYIGGIGLSRGYISAPDLTAEKFVPDPFGAPGSRLYRSGDRVRYLENGMLEFLGRIDNQVKIRGYRIEPGEIESVLGQHASVNECAVIVREDIPGEKRLVAYVVLKSGMDNLPTQHGRDIRGTTTPAINSAEALSELQAFLTQKLPSYMLPSAFVLLEKMPLNANGKVDRKSLPPPGERHRETRSLTEPSVPLHQQLILIWEDLLHVSPIGITDNFFDLGGHSLLALRMMDRIEQISGIRVPLTALFSGPTIADIAEHMLRHSKYLDSSSAVSLNSLGTKSPLFFFHGDILGKGLYCYNLSRHLGADQPLYALHPPDLAAGQFAPSVEEMAAAQIRTIRKIQPRGPYSLGGFCMGGIVALEVALQLQAQGEKIAALVAIDSSSPQRIPRLIRYYAEFVGTLRGCGPLEKIRILQRGLSWFDWFGAKLGANVGDSLTMLVRVARRLPKRLSETRRQEPARNPEEEKSSNLLWMFRWALFAYKPRRFPGRMDLVLSNEFSQISDPNLGWQGIAREIAICRVPGDHLACLTTHVEVMAAHISRCLPSR